MYAFSSVCEEKRLRSSQLFMMQVLFYNVDIPRRRVTLLAVSTFLHSSLGGAMVLHISIGQSCQLCLHCYECETVRYSAHRKMQWA